MSEMTDKEKLAVVMRAISKRACPGRGYDECTDGGCFGGGRVCSLHDLLSPEMLAAREKTLERAETRNLEHLRKENKALKERMKQLQRLITEPLNLD